MAETDMVTKVARALHEHFGEPRPGMAPLIPWGGLEPKHQAYWYNAARAAIAALREPSKKMLVAGEDAFEEFKDETEDSDAEGNRHVSFFYHAGVEAHVWQAMIDAALATPQTEKGE